MNKYNKNILWLNLEKLITFTVVAGMIILTVALATSCSTTNELSKYHYQEYPCSFTK